MIGGTLGDVLNLNSWPAQEDGFEHHYRGPPFKLMVDRDSSECVGNVGSGRIKADSSGSKSPDVISEADYPMGLPSLHDNADPTDSGRRGSST